MKEIMDFLLVYWKELFYAFCALLSLVCVIFSKRKVKVFDSPFEVVVQKVPSLINKAEQLFSSGIDKKRFVVNSCITLLSDITHKSFESVSVYSEKFSRIVEDILSTPTKKGERSETTNEKIH